MKSLWVIKQNNLLYKCALKREIGIWKNSRQTNFLDNKFHKVEFMYDNNTYHIENNKDWIDFISNFGPFKNVLVLGGNNTTLEKYLIEKKIADNIENIDIIYDNNSNMNKFADLNFIDLPSNRYDLVIAKSILHHIVNLEHLLYQVNKTLLTNGLFLVFEYVGENKQQWDSTKIELINKQFMASDIIPNYQFDKLKENYFNNWPFESIRSQEITEILPKVFTDKVIEIKWGGLNWPIDYHIRQFCINNHISLTEAQIQILKHRANKIDKYYHQNQSIKIQPSYLFGIYNKSTDNKAIHVIRWDKTKIKKEFQLNGPLKVRIRSLLTTYNDTFIVKGLVTVKKISKNINFSKRK